MESLEPQTLPFGQEIAWEGAKGRSSETIPTFPPTRTKKCGLQYVGAKSGKTYTCCLSEGHQSEQDCF